MDVFDQQFSCLLKDILMNLFNKNRVLKTYGFQFQQRSVAHTKSENC